MIVAKDILGRDLKVDDPVLYARKQSYTANGELVQCIIIRIYDDYIALKPEDIESIYRSTEPNRQLYKL